MGYVLHLDESLRWRLIVVGGFICEHGALVRVAENWASMRRTMGLIDGELLKWNFGQKSKTRARLESAGWNKIKRNELVIATIAALPAVLIADGLYDARRGLSRGPLDFYRYGIDYLCTGLRNYACWDMGSDGPHLVVIDSPSPPPRPRPGTDDSSFEWLKDREHIWHVHYGKRYREGFKSARAHIEPLADDGFYPSLLVSNAKFNPLLEIADAVAGLALDFLEYNMKGFAASGKLPPESWEDELLAQLVAKFRGGPDGHIGRRGFTLFPSWAPGAESVYAWLDRLCERAQARA